MDYLERNRDFKGVWIPKAIWLNENLTMLEKVILVEIDSLDNQNHCIAGNEYLSQFCQCSEWKVSQAVKKLLDLGYIELVSFDGRHRKLKSCIWKALGQHLENPKSESGKPKANNINNNIDSNIAMHEHDENVDNSDPDTSLVQKSTLTNSPPPATGSDFQALVNSWMMASRVNR